MFSSHPSATQHETTAQTNSSASPHSTQSTADATVGSHLSHLPQNHNTSIESRLQSIYKEENLLDSELDIDSFKSLHHSPSAQPFFGRSAEVNPLTLRSSSDPTLALHAAHGRLQAIREQANTSNESAGLAETLPSFKEIYPIKYNQQLSEIGLKMDEDCFQMVTSNLPNPASNFHPGNGQHMSHTFGQDHDSFNELNMHPSSQQHQQQHLALQQQSQLQGHFISCQFISPNNTTSNSGYQYQQAPSQQVHPPHMVSYNNYHYYFI